MAADDKYFVFIFNMSLTMNPSSHNFPSYPVTSVLSLYLSLSLTYTYKCTLTQTTHTHTDTRSDGVGGYVIARVRVFKNTH